MGANRAWFVAMPSPVMPFSERNSSRSTYCSACCGSEEIYSSLILPLNIIQNFTSLKSLSYDKVLSHKLGPRKAAWASILHHSSPSSFLTSSPLTSFAADLPGMKNSGYDCYTRLLSKVGDKNNPPGARWRKSVTQGKFFLIFPMRTLQSGILSVESDWGSQVCD